MTALRSQEIFDLCLPQDLQGSFICSARNSEGLTRKKISMAGTEAGAEAEAGEK